MNCFKYFVVTGFFWILAITAEANITVAKVMGDNMVLQRDQPIEMWGWGTPGERIELTIDSREYKGKVGKNGSWNITIDEFPAGGPYQMVIAGKNRIIINNIMFGEVWLCSGQSNMQFTLRMLGKDPSKIEHVNNDSIRMLTIDIGADLLPAGDIKGGQWTLASEQTVPDFSATAYYFGKLLYDSLKVPIGLINSSLGATSIETWMSSEALKLFPQFEKIISKRQLVGKTVDQLAEDLEIFRESWDNQHYLLGPGFKGEWYDPDFDDSNWATINNPNFWEYEGLNHHGAVWYRKNFDLPIGFVEDSFLLQLNQIDDYDVTWVNGIKVGETFGNRNWRNYKVPSSLLKPRGNQVTVRVFDIGELGGMHTSAFWGNPILNGEWKYKPGLTIDPDSFPVPEIANGSIFSYPGMLYNANIAPLRKVRIKGVIWYQGEANAYRAYEYKSLLLGLIGDWREKWSRQLPFLVVQLANYGQEIDLPAPSTWAELREAQHNAVSLKGVNVATAIDIGEANDIHPKNKEDVGKRLAWQALTYTYNYEFLSESPVMNSISFENGKGIVSFSQTGDGLVNSNKYGYIRGFQIAGNDQKYHWAKAWLDDNQIIVESPEVKEPVAVRYAWADNPGSLDIWNSSGLPLLPFRTDNWTLSTAGRTYDDTPHQF